MTFFRRTIPNRNAGRAKYVQQEIDYQVSRASATLTESLMPDSVELTYWRRTDEGNFCHCGFGLNHPQNPNAQGSIVLNNEITVNPNEAAIPPAQKPKVVIKNAWGDTTVKDEEEHAESTLLPNNPKTPTPQDTAEDDFLSSPEGYDLLTGQEKTQCGICLGAGKINAWTLLGGRREIFEYYTVNELSGFTKREDTRPISFQSANSKKAYAQWIYQIPTYYEKCLNFEIRNNTQAVRYLGLFFKVQGSSTDFQLLTQPIINSFKGTPTVLILRVQPLRDDLNGVIEFTHIEIDWQFSDFPRAQMDKVSTATNQQIRDTIITSSFTLPPSIEMITKNDVFYENKYGKMWQLTDFSGGLTAKRQVLDWTVSARNMQPYEQRSLLQIAHQRFYQIGFDGLSRFELDFRL